MKTKLLALAFALLSFVSYTQTYVPDDNFEQALIDLGYDVGPLDDYVPTANINSVETLDVSSKSISSLEGIGGFVALNILNCSSNNLTDLNLSANTSLVALFCQFNILTDLTLPNTTSLLNLYCNNNQLTTLDISNTTGLQLLYCGNNLLNSIDLNNHPDLNTLHIESNSLSVLDASSNSNFYDLNCSDNGITDLDLSNLFFLAFLDCSQNMLTDLNLTTNVSLFQLIISSNSFTELLLNGVHTLSYLDCSANSNLSVLSVPGNLNSLNAAFCNLSSINAPAGLPQIEGLSLINNVFLNLDVSVYPNLQLLACDNNQLTTLNLKNGNNVNFSLFSATGNNLTCITVDDVAYSTSNWTNIDLGVVYSTDCTLGIDEFDLSSISMFPNPVRDLLQVDLQINANYTLTNLFGQEVKKGLLVFGNNELDVSSLSNGLYLLNIDTHEGKTTKKLIKH